jgi:DNA-binding CsgD family transcriptional regulator
MKTYRNYPVEPVKWSSGTISSPVLNGAIPMHEYLTRREIEIICLLSEDYDSIEVAGLLCISRNTVDTHRKNIMKKIKAKSVVGVVRFAFANGLIKI